MWSVGCLVWLPENESACHLVRLGKKCLQLHSLPLASCNLTTFTCWLCFLFLWFIWSSKKEMSVSSSCSKGAGLEEFCYPRSALIWSSCMLLQLNFSFQFFFLFLVMSSSTAFISPHTHTQHSVELAAQHGYIVQEVL